MSCSAVLATAALLSLQTTQGGQGSCVELALVQQQLAALQQLFEARLTGLEQELLRLGEAVTRASASPEPLAAPFLASPPPSSDAVGVARVPVFKPRLVVDSPARYDLVFVRVFRLEAEGRLEVARVELGQDPAGVALPLDRSGALYLVEWSTSDGHSYELQLRDGLSGLVAAAVKVKPLEHEGRFLMVGYRAE
jgi:hypothetical protein